MHAETSVVDQTNFSEENKYLKELKIHRYTILYLWMIDL